MYICIYVYMYMCIYVYIYMYIYMWVYIFIYNLYNIFPEFSLLGQPQNLTESEFDDNITNIHVVNNRNLHPAQRRIAQSQSQRPSTTPGTGEASAIQLTSEPTRPALPSNQAMFMSSSDEAQEASAVQLSSNPTRPALPSNQAMIMSSGNEAQEVTQKCPMPDCQWTS